MKYRVLIKKKAEKSLSKISEPYYSSIKSNILALANNPRPNGCKKLKGREGYRIRIGNYRVLYRIEDDILTVEVVNVGHRKEIYSK